MVYPVDPDGIGTKTMSYGQELKEQVVYNLDLTDGYLKAACTHLKDGHVKDG